MKKPLKNLEFKKETISKLELDKIKGGHANGEYFGTLICPTQGALNSCPPPGWYCL